MRPIRSVSVDKSDTPSNVPPQARHPYRRASERAVAIPLIAGISACCQSRWLEGTRSRANRGGFSQTPSYLSSRAISGSDPRSHFARSNSSEYSSLDMRGWSWPEVRSRCQVQEVLRPPPRRSDPRFFHRPAGLLRRKANRRYMRDRQTQHGDQSRPAVLRAVTPSARRRLCLPRSAA